MGDMYHEIVLPPLYPIEEALMKADKDGNNLVEGNEIEVLKGILHDKFCIEIPQDIVTQLDRITGVGKTEPDQRIDRGAVRLHLIFAAEVHRKQLDPLLQLKEKTCKSLPVA